MLEGIMLWCLTLVGMTYLACDAEVLTPMRLQFRALHPVVDRMLNCHICTSFWMSMPTSMLLVIFYSLAEYESAQVLFGVFGIGPIAAVGVSAVLNLLSPMTAFTAFSKRMDGKK